MTMPLAPAAFARHARALGTRIVDGIAPATDIVASHAPQTHCFLRARWFAAAIAAYGGQARTLIVEAEGMPVLALPMVAVGPPALRLAAIPGSYWPFRSFPLSLAAGEEALAAALVALARDVRALRIGPVYEDDPAAAPLARAARDAGWTVLHRHVARAHVLDIAAARAQGAWPRTSTLRKNRFHEKHLAAQGTLDWRFAAPEDWPATFDAMAAVEAHSWIAHATDGHDAKFTATGHGTFWRTAARDPVLAKMFHAALLDVDGTPAAFSFDLDVGTFRYAIANSYDPQFAKHSPGKLLHYRNLIAAADRGTACVDWGAGDSGYKETLGAVPGAAIVDLLLIPPGMWGMLARMLGPIWRRSGR